MNMITRLQYCEPLSRELEKKSFVVIDGKGMVFFIDFIDSSWARWQRQDGLSEFCQYGCLKATNGLYLICFVNRSKRELPSTLILDKETGGSVLLFPSEDGFQIQRARYMRNHLSEGISFCDTNMDGLILQWKLGENCTIIQQIYDGKVIYEQGEKAVEGITRILKIREDFYLICTHASEIGPLGPDTQIILDTGRIRATGCTWRYDEQEISPVLFSGFGSFKEQL